ncbi:ABC transporter permease subunit [Pseudomonas sp. MRSN 12121]|uniref:ABC transporter permease subunit n=1 Tax=Pseudomonas sp. MRSN 12121 TaxID=1611770 RepID=UPI0005BEB9AF|nr:ABC transporter permease subunit [Pseudomonas sp. MRSN 12121]AJO78670.1 ABC transporter permease [Pseudomonas sp. MRSN 12121]
MSVLGAIIKREVRGYFETPVAYVFIVVFLLLSGFCTFYPGALFERNQADLAPFFHYQPWLCLLLMPALAMRLWSEEFKSGSIELLLSLPVNSFGVALGKFLASWLVAGVALLLTFPVVLTVNYLGQPDNGAILCGYLAALLLAGCFLAISGCVSALTRHQSIAFVLAVMLCLLFSAFGMPSVQEVFRPWVDAQWLDQLASLSVLGHYAALSEGVLLAQNLVYFASQIVLWWLATALLVELRRVG